MTNQTPRRRKNQGREQLDVPTTKTPAAKAQSFDDLRARIKPVAEVESFLKVLVYGRSGTGKTTIISSFPKPMLVLDIREKGTESIADIDGVQVFEAVDWNDLELMANMLQNNPTEWKSVVIDTISMAQTMLVNNILEEEGQAKMTQPLWGEVSGAMNPFILQLRDLPMHVAFIAHDRTRIREEDTEGDVEPEVGPALIPSVVKTLNGAVSVIGQTYIHEKQNTTPTGIVSEFQYRLRVGPHPFFTTKVRSPQTFKIPQSIKDANFTKLQKLTKGEK